VASAAQALSARTLVRTLLLLRHAKSDRSDASLDDHARPLNERGRRAARRVGKLLREQKLLPERVLCSSATRALETARGVLETSRSEAPLDVHRELYLSSPSEYVKVLQGVPDELQRVLVVGHNPDLEDLLERLTGASEPLPTAALAMLGLPISKWQKLEFGIACELRRVWRVKELD
jgi:phosphohistidine phosphatase